MFYNLVNVNDFAINSNDYDGPISCAAGAVIKAWPSALHCLNNAFLGDSQISESECTFGIAITSLYAAYQPCNKRRF